MRLATAAAFSVLALVAPVRAQNSDATWPPPGVHRLNEPGIAAPRVVSQVRPIYTRAAMSARIQGSVSLECIVETDGSVGAVRVVKSLDAANGLDGQAVGAAKQWRFRPATKDGVPVAVLVTIDLSFALGDRRPDLRLPEGFSTGAVDSREWTVVTVDAADAHISAALPSGWTRREATGAAILTLSYLDANSSAQLSITRPTMSRSPISGPIPEAELQTRISALRQLFSTQGTTNDIRANGQFALVDRFWLWVELAVPAPAVLGGSAPLWWFGTTEGDDLVSVVTSIQLRPDASDDEKSAAMKAEKTTIVEFLRRLTITR